MHCNVVAWVLTVATVIGARSRARNGRASCRPATDGGARLHLDDALHPALCDPALQRSTSISAVSSSVSPVRSKASTTSASPLVAAPPTIDGATTRRGWCGSATAPGTQWRWYKTALTSAAAWHCRTDAAQSQNLSIADTWCPPAPSAVPRGYWPLLRVAFPPSTNPAGTELSFWQR